MRYPFVFAPFLVFFIASSVKVGPITANIKFEGNLQVEAPVIVEELEKRAGSNFLTDPNADFEIIVSYKPLMSDTLGLTIQRAGVCYIALAPFLDVGDRNFNPHYPLRMVLAHEIGHCFGLRHIGDERAIMYYESIPQLQMNEMSWFWFIRSLNGARGAN